MMEANEQISFESAVENGRESAMRTNEILDISDIEDEDFGDSDEENTFTSSISSLGYVHDLEPQNNAIEQIVVKPNQTQNISVPNEPLTESTVSNTASTHPSHLDSPSPNRAPQTEGETDNGEGVTKEGSAHALNDDEVAKNLTNLMSRGASLGAVLNAGISIAERSTLKESIMAYSSHVPKCVVADLVADVLNEQDAEAVRRRSTGSTFPEAAVAQRRGSLQRSLTRKPMVIPHKVSYECALLFVDISGFTAISRLLDVESLSKAINSYFQKIVDMITSYGGDVLKFAGDAIFAEWRVGSLVSESKAFNQNTMTMVECVTCAASCGAQIVAKFSDEPVYSNTVTGGMGSKRLASLSVHCGLGSGTLMGIHVGCSDCRREYIVIGDPIDQVQHAESKASLGELVISAPALQVLRRGCHLKKELNIAATGKNAVLLAKKRSSNFVPKRKVKIKSSNGVYELRKPSYPKIPFDKMESSSLKKLHQLLSFYIHDVVSDDAVSSGKVNAIIRGGQVTLRRQRAEAELRNICTLFIMPLINAKLSKSSKMNEKTITLLNNILRLVSTILRRFKGHLRQFIVDDKGVVLIATFGLRGSTFPNLVSERAIPACRIIHAALRSELGVASQIGATRGRAYCGVVGGIKRHEYAVLGPSVNLAARLMTLSNHPGILVDNALRVRANCNFMALPPVKAKGYSSLVPIFKPLTTREALWGKINPNFVGRRKEMKELCKLSQDLATLSGSPVNIRIVMGESGSGKSAFIFQTLAVMKKMLASAGKRVIIARNASNEGDSMVPFSILRGIFQEILRDIQLTLRSRSNGSEKANVASASQQSRNWENMSLSSMSSKRTNMTLENAFYDLCDRLNASENIVHFVGNLLLGDKSEMPVQNEEAPSIAEVVNFLADAFITSTSHTDLVILALDDVQWMDSSSWNVVQKVFETGQNVLILCGTRSLRSYNLTVNSDFWDDLCQKYKYDNRYCEIDMGPLTETDIVDLVTKSLSCRRSEVDGKVSKDIFLHSGGMPLFASEIIKACMKNKLFERGKNKKIRWKESKGRQSNLSDIQVATLDELITSRIDNLNDSVRKVLQIASVLGAEFDERGVRSVYEKLFSLQNDKMSISNALSEAVEEGILEETIFEEEEEDIGATSDRLLSMTVDTADSGMSSSINHTEKKMYRFHHDKWLRIISSLLLTSFKRDIHLYAALTLESRQSNSNMIDYQSKLNLMRHWKGCGNIDKVCEIALEVGKSYKDHALFSSSVMVYNEAIAFWKEQDPEDEDRVAGVSSICIESLDADSLQQIVMLHTAKGQALGSEIKHEESMVAFASALQIYNSAPVKDSLRDRAFVFPIFSGLFFLLKYAGTAIGESESAYEKNLVSNFVNETKEHGDPVHYCRALAMEVDMFSRLCDWERAIESQERIKDIYRVDEHSTKISEVYASDRVAQSFGISAICYIQLEQTQKIHAVCDFVLKELMPKMDITNVHNSMMCLYRVIWALKDYGRVSEAKEAFRIYILQAFQDHYGEDARTPTMSYFKPIEILFDLCDTEECTRYDEYCNWVLNEENCKFSPFLNNSMRGFARDADSILAEICLILLKKGNKKTPLLRKGLDLAAKSMKLAKGDDDSITFLFAYNQAKKVFDALQTFSDKMANHTTEIRESSEVVSIAKAP